MRKIIYKPNQVINGLTYLEECPSLSDNKNRKVKLKCFCGNIFITRIYNIKSKHTTSCGCQKGGVVHKLSRHPLYQTWIDMRRRCYNEDRKGYKYWGGKGIEICDEWLNDFKSFYDWALKNNWEKGLTIERKDSDGNYEPNNCEFITKTQNSKNIWRKK